MRTELKTINGLRARFVGVFVRYGVKNGWRGRTEQTVLLSDIRDAATDRPICDHLWFNLTLGFSRINLAEGDEVEFDARVRPYQKGYQGHRDEVFANVETDYKLSFPTQFKKREAKPRSADAQQLELN